MTTSRSHANRKAAIPCWTDDVKYLEKCGAEKCKGLADLTAHAGVDNVPEDCIKKVTTGQLCCINNSLQLVCAYMKGQKDICSAL